MSKTVVQGLHAVITAEAKVNLANTVGLLFTMDEVTRKMFLISDVELMLDW